MLLQNNLFRVNYKNVNEQASSIESGNKLPLWKQFIYSTSLINFKTIEVFTSLFLDNLVTNLVSTILKIIEISFIYTNTFYHILYI